MTNSSNTKDTQGGLASDTSPTVGTNQVANSEVA
jgi:hypothetical protein